LIKNLRVTFVLSLLAAGWIAGSARAVIVQTNSYSATSEVAFPVSATDLINQGQPSFSNQAVSGFAPFSCCGGQSDTAALNDGSAGTPSTSGGTAFDLDGTWTSTFNLNLATNTSGYDITGVQTFTGWPDQRTDQKYELLYSTATSPGAFISLGTFAFGPAAGGSAVISLTDTTGAIATHVAAVRFNIQAPGFVGADESVWREIDVMGAASVVPEPYSLVLLGLGTVGFGAMVLRRRSKACRRQIADL